MKNIYAEIEYIGTNYCGFQKQKNAVTIESVLEEAIFKATSNVVKLIGSGRTDAGVHAIGQVVNFFVDTNIPAENLAKIINKYLPDDIKVKNTKEVSSDFNARYSAKKKTYLYKVKTGDSISVFEKNFYGYYNYEVNMLLLKQVLKEIEGTHDFKAFMSTGSNVNDTIRTIYKTKATRCKDTINIEVTGDGFLYNMVRIIVGTVLMIASSRLPYNNIKLMLKNGDRKLGGKTFAPQGLYLKKVCYNFNKKLDKK